MESRWLLLDFEEVECGEERSDGHLDAEDEHEHHASGGVVRGFDEAGERGVDQVLRADDCDVRGACHEVDREALVAFQTVLRDLLHAHDDRQQHGEGADSEEEQQRDPHQHDAAVEVEHHEEDEDRRREQVVPHDVVLGLLEVALDQHREDPDQQSHEQPRRTVHEHQLVRDQRVEPHDDRYDHRAHARDRIPAAEVREDQQQVRPLDLEDFEGLPQVVSDLYFVVDPGFPLRQQRLP